MLKEVVVVLETTPLNLTDLKAFKAQVSHLIATLGKENLVSKEVAFRVLYGVSAPD